MDLADKIINITKEEGYFKDNIYEIVNLNDDTKDDLFFIQVDTLKEMHLLRDKLYQYRYLHEKDQDFSNRIQADDDFPYYVLLNGKLKDAHCIISVIICDIEYLEYYKEEYDVVTIPINDILYKEINKLWI